MPRLFLFVWGFFVVVVFFKAVVSSKLVCCLDAPPPPAAVTASLLAVGKFLPISLRYKHKFECLEMFWFGKHELLLYVSQRSMSHCLQ